MAPLTTNTNRPVTIGFQPSGVDRSTEVQPQNTTQRSVTDGFNANPARAQRLPVGTPVDGAFVSTSPGVQLASVPRLNQALPPSAYQASARDYASMSKVARAANLSKPGADAVETTSVAIGAHLGNAGKWASDIQMAREMLRRPGLSAVDREKLSAFIAENANNPEYNRPRGPGQQATDQDLRSIQLSANDLRMARQAVAAHRSEEAAIGAPTEINQQPQARRPQSDDNRVDPTNIPLGGLSKAGLARRADAEAEKLAIRRDQRSVQSQEIVTDRRQVVQRTEIGGGATTATGGAVTRTAV